MSVSEPHLVELLDEMCTVHHAVDQLQLLFHTFLRHVLIQKWFAILN